MIIVKRISVIRSITVYEISRNLSGHERLFALFAARKKIQESREISCWETGKPSPSAPTGLAR